MSVGLFQIAIIALVILVLFGRGRISELMGDFGRGIKSFRQSLSETEQPLQAPVAEVEPAKSDKTTR
jgi:sec-independent protein translocase protein TatA